MTFETWPYKARLAWRRVNGGLWDGNRETGAGGRPADDGRRTEGAQARPGAEPAHPPAAAGSGRADAAAHGVAQHPDHAGAGLDRADRDLLGGAPGHRRAGRHGAGLSGGHADADHLGRRDGRRHLGRDRPRAGPRQPRRRRRPGAARRRHQRRAGPRLLGHHAGVRPADLPGAGRDGRRARSGTPLFQRGVRRQRAAVGDERAGQRHPRHRQHAGAGDRDLRRRRLPGAAVAAC